MSYPGPAKTTAATMSNAGDRIPDHVILLANDDYQFTTRQMVFYFSVPVSQPLSLPCLLSPQEQQQPIIGKQPHSNHFLARSPTASTRNPSSVSVTLI